jgi:glycosyltransferase involved in cell wall biosynthesis
MPVTPGHTPRILFVATVSSTIGRFLAPHAIHMRSLGWRVDAAAAGARTDPALADSFDAVHELPLSRSIRSIRSMLAGERAMADLLRSQAWDIVHVHTPIAAFATRVAIRRMPPERRPALVYTAHGFHFFEGGPRLANRIFLTAERVAGRWTDRLIVLNDEDERAAIRYRLVPRRHLVRHPGVGLDTSHFGRERVPIAAADAVRLAADIPPSAPLFVTVGELNANKRHEDAIEALASLGSGDAHLLVAGQGPALPELRQLAQASGVRDRVHFAGFVTDIRPTLSSATALIAPSRREGLSRSVMEALALEVPVIASDARGNVELVDDSGYVVRVGDVAGIARGMASLIDRPALGTEMGQRGRARMVARYDLALVSRMHQELYEDLVMRRPSPLGTDPTAPPS